MIFSGINTTNQKGSVLVMVAVLAFSMFLLGLAYLGFVNRAVLNTDDLVTEIQAIYAASAAMIDGIVYTTIYEPGTDYHMKVVEFYENVEYEGYIYFSGYSSGIYSIDADYVVVGVGIPRSYSGIERPYEISSQFIKETFADYLYITDDEHDMVEGQQIYFWTPDTLDGKVHTNDAIHIMPWSDRPVFKKRVTSSASYISPPDNHARFDEGLFLNQPEIIFPDQADEVRHYAGDMYTYGCGHPDSVYWLAFLGAGYKLRKSGDRGDTWSMDWPELPLIQLPASGAIYVNGKCWISTTQFPDSANPHDGRLDGQVTVASSDTMYIRGQTLYSCFDEVNSIVPMSCDDALGLISEKWVLISDRLPGWHYGIKINSGIAALRGSFSVDKIYTYAQEHQSLFVYGSIAQYHRGIVHRGSCGSGIGYCQKDYKYDDRFRKNPPPHFISIKDRRPIYHEDFYPG
jgi:hypothetical protein